MPDKTIIVSVANQTLQCCKDKTVLHEYPVSTAKNGMGELKGSECTPRGWHRVHSLVGMGAAENSVFVSRVWTGEIYDEALAKEYPDRDWILTRIIRLDGLEPGFNKGGDVDTLQRYIYIHGTPDSNSMQIPLSHGCIRMRNSDVIKLADWVSIDTRVFIQ